MTSKRLCLSLILFFMVTRLFIWIYRPQTFTEIIYSYMPYAHRWDNGEIPYLQMWYEYPPATIPLFYIPHLLDKTFPGITYLVFYRGILLLIDAGIFALIWTVLKKFSVSKGVFVGGLVYYILSTAKAHHFVYDTMDLTFAASIFFSVAAPIALDKILNKNKFSSVFLSTLSWLGFWLATALKLVNAPLAAVNVILERRNPVRMILAIVIAATLVWGLPLLYFRSSLQVILVYHQLRGLQIESFPSVIAQSINRFTNSETVIEAYKNYEITGPISDSIKEFFGILFPLALMSVILYGMAKAFLSKADDMNFIRLHATLAYILVFMFTGKVLSTPFLLWHIPLLAIYPFSSLKQQLSFTIPSFIIVLLSMTPIPNIPIGIFSLHIFIGWSRSILFIYLFIMLIVIERRRCLLNKVLDEK